MDHENILVTYAFRGEMRNECKQSGKPERKETEEKTSISPTYVDCVCQDQQCTGYIGCALLPFQQLSQFCQVSL